MEGEGCNTGTNGLLSHSPKSYFLIINVRQYSTNIKYKNKRTCKTFMIVSCLSKKIVETKIEEEREKNFDCVMYF